MDGMGFVEKVAPIRVKVRRCRLSEGARITSGWKLELEMMEIDVGRAVAIAEGRVVTG